MKVLPTTFPFKREEILVLADSCLAILKSQPIVLEVRAPVKVFGDVHGQYQDLMRFFDLWGSPTDHGNGDIEANDYLFLGDYVDRGSNSLETVCLLIALKVRYPDQIHLLRGNHEDRLINNVFGFGEECANRLGEDVASPTSVYSKLNLLFDWLPLAATIDNKILCLHGGIGQALKELQQVRQLERPLEVVHEAISPEEQLLVDILWSDPTDNDEETGIQNNYIRDPNQTGNIVKFGPDIVEDFLQRNKLMMILRAHECVMDGFERFAGGSLITIFSATDYCHKYKNAGALLFINRKYEITPQLIYPDLTSEEDPTANEGECEGKKESTPRWSNG